MSSGEEKKYAQLTRESISLLADSAGFADIPDSVSELLAEDVNYRIREMLQKASHLMRHAKRRKLNCEDFNKALRLGNVDPIYGYRNPEPLQLLHIKECDVYAIDDADVSFSTIATTDANITRITEPSVKAQWLSLDGAAVTSSTSHTSASVRRNIQTAPTVSENLMNYYDQITKAILGSDTELLKLAFDDLQSNFQISPLMPYLVNFVSVGVKKMSHDLTQLTKLLQTVDCLVSNKSLYLGTHPYLTLLTQSVLYCILEPLAASINPINDHWTLRDTAALLLARILRQWSDPINNLYNQIVTTLRDSFCDLMKPFSTHYGASVALLALGIQEMKDYLYPNISFYWPRLVRTLDDCSYNSAQLKADAQKVHGILLLVSELLIRHYQKVELDKEGEQETVEDSQNDKIKLEKQEPLCIETSSGDSPCHMYLKLYEFFGDALASRLPYLRVSGLYKPKVEVDINLFTTPELLISGEEYLETFNEKEEELRSNNSMEYENSDDENSVMSDDHEAGKVELQIRSTISDPGAGIKITIAKLRPVAKPPQVEEPKVVKKKRFNKEPREQEPVFEYVTWKHGSIGQMVGIDLMGPFPLSPRRNQYLCVMTDYCTRAVELSPLKTATAKEVATSFIDLVVCRHGCPRILFSDNGPQFISDILYQTTQLLGIRQSFSSVYHPQSNLVERVNQNIGMFLAAYTGEDHTQWDQNLSLFRLVLNTTINDSTRFTPYFLNHGREARLPDHLDPVAGQLTETEIPEEVRLKWLRDLATAYQAIQRNVSAAREKHKRYYDAHHRDLVYTEGQLVWKRNRQLSRAGSNYMAKLAPKWQGPFSIIRMVTPVTAHLREPERHVDAGIHHISDLKVYHCRIWEEERDESSIGGEDREQVEERQVEEGEIRDQDHEIPDVEGQEGPEQQENEPPDPQERDSEVRDEEQERRENLLLNQGTLHSGQDSEQFLNIPEEDNMVLAQTLPTTIRSEFDNFLLRKEQEDQLNHDNSEVMATSHILIPLSPVPDITQYPAPDSDVLTPAPDSDVLTPAPDSDVPNSGSTVSTPGFTVMLADPTPGSTVPPPEGSTPTLITVPNSEVSTCPPDSNAPVTYSVIMPSVPETRGVPTPIPSSVTVTCPVTTFPDMPNLDPVVPPPEMTDSTWPFPPTLTPYSPQAHLATTQGIYHQGRGMKRSTDDEGLNLDVENIEDLNISKTLTALDFPGPSREAGGSRAPQEILRATRTRNKKSKLCVTYNSETNLTSTVTDRPVRECRKRQAPPTWLPAPRKARQSQLVMDTCSANPCTLFTLDIGKGSDGTSDMVDWVYCDFCTQWYHQECERITSAEVKTVPKYRCRKCDKLRVSKT